MSRLNQGKLSLRGKCLQKSGTLFQCDSLDRFKINNPYSIVMHWFLARWVAMAWEVTKERERAVTAEVFSEVGQQTADQIVFTPGSAMLSSLLSLCSAQLFSAFLLLHCAWAMLWHAIEMIAHALQPSWSSVMLARSPVTHTLVGGRSLPYRITQPQNNGFHT